MFGKVKVLCALVVIGLGLAAHSAAPTVTSVAAQQRYPWNGLVDITVTFNGAESDVAKVNCTFAATNSATKTALAIAHVTQQGNDTGSGTTWTRRFIWDTNADLGEVKIEDVELVANVEAVAEEPDGLGGVQLWEGGPYWAECNVGASKSEEYGLYFMWGYTVGHDGEEAVFPSYTCFPPYYYGTNDYCVTYSKSYDELLSLGYIDSTGHLTPAHDAARAHFGAPWRMPTFEEFGELLNKCARTWTMRNGVNGLLVTGKDAYASRAIFLPAAGDCADFTRYYLGIDGGYWTSTTEPSYYGIALSMWIHSTCSFNGSWCSRYVGMPVRPVRESASSLHVVYSVHLSLDNRTGTRIAESVEPIRFSPAWETDLAGARAVVSTNGVAAKTATVAGAFDWTPSHDGIYRFTHTVSVNGIRVGETLSAIFVVGAVGDVITLNPPVVNEQDASINLTWNMNYSSDNLRFDVYRSDSPDFASASAVGENVTAKFFKDDTWSQSYGKSEALYYWVVGKDGDLRVPSEMATAVVKPPEFEFAVDLHAGCASLKKYRGTKQTVWIPEVAYFDKSGVQLPAAASSAGEAYPVTGIESSAFANNKTLQELYIPDSVETIGEYAFLGCEKLWGVKLGKGITRIPPYAFAYLKSLEKVVIGGCITEDIGGYAFAGCTSLKEIVGGGMRPTSVFLNAFYHVPAEFSIDFSDCTFIGPEAFCGCKGFWGSGYAEPLSLPKITEIWDSAFEGCESILGLWCGKELKCIGSRAFAESGMREVRFDGKPPESVGEDAFGDLSTIPEGVASAYYFSEWRTVISDTGMWHGVHFPMYDWYEDEYGLVAYSLVAFDDNDQANSVFDARQVTAIVAKHIKGPGGREIMMEVDRCSAAFDAVEFRPHVYGYGDFEVWFEYADGSWASTIRYDEFTVPFEGVREKTIFFRRTDAEWTLNVQLYDEKNTKLPFASRSYSSGTKPELGTADVIVPLYTLPEPSVAKPTALFGDYALQWYYYKDDDKIGELIDESLICIYGWNDKRLTGETLRLFAKWEWYFLESEREKMNKLLTHFKFKEDRGVFYNSFAYDGETKDLTITVDEGSGGQLSFDWRTSCEAANGSGEFRDHAEFLVDGEVVATSDGESMWKRVSVDLSGGKSHTVTWRYVKDDGGSAGEDCVWVSDIQFAAISDEETSDELLDESEYNWFYEDTPVRTTPENPFEYNPSVTPEEATCQVDVLGDIGVLSRSSLQEAIPEGMQAGICRVEDAVGLEYAVVTSDGWEMVGNANLASEVDEEVKASFVVDYSTTPSTIKYMISGHTLTNAEGTSTFVCAAQKSHVESLLAKGKGSCEIHSWAGKYDVVNADVQQVAPGTETELAAGLDTFQNETFQVSGGGTLVIPCDKIPAGGVRRRLHVDGNSAIKFDLSGLTTIPTVLKLFNGVGSSFMVGPNMEVIVLGEGVDRVSKLFVKNGDLEARVAERPEIGDDGTQEEPFTVNVGGDSSTVSALVGNAVEGFWYGLLSVDLLGGDFLLDPDSVKQCTGTGPLRLESSANANGDSGFYRISVSADKP